MLELEDPRPDDREDPCPELLPELMLPLLNLPNRPPRLRPPAALPPDPPDLLKRPLNFPISPPLPEDLLDDRDDPWFEDEVIRWPEDVELPLLNLANRPPSPRPPAALPPEEEDPPDLLKRPLNLPISPPLPEDLLDDLDDPWFEFEVILWPEDVELPLPNLAKRPPSPRPPAALPPDEEDPPDLLNNPLNFPIKPPLPDPDDEELPPLLKRPLNLPMIPPEDELPEDPWPEERDP